MHTSNRQFNNRGFTVGSAVAIVSLVVVLIAGLLLVKVRSIEGNESAVVTTWSGIQEQPRGTGTHFFIPGIYYSVAVYDMGLNIFAMNDKDNPEEVAEGRKADSYLVQSRDQQDLRISMRLQWKRLPNKLVALHKYAPTNVEERLIRPALQNIVKNRATLLTALEAYSGESLVKLQSDILADLRSNEELSQFIYVDGFQIEHIGLDPKYTAEIVARQVAVQERLKNIEQTKAAEAAAEKAKAEAQANYEKTLVEARRDKEKGILAAEQAAQQQVLAAEANAKQVAVSSEAEKNRNILIAEGERDAALNRAQAITALGEAEAAAMKLKLGAYAAPGAEGFVRIEVAKSMAEAFKNIDGYLPESMNVNLLAEQYSKGVNLLVGGNAAAK